MIIKPPQKFSHVELTKVFLAGSIEMGQAEDWQSIASKYLDDEKVCVLNPRRDSWDASWEQNLSNKPFVDQVQWEIKGIKEAALVLFYFVPHTKSPITIGEFYYSLGRKNMIVCCPEGFWRKGNIDIMCIDNQVEVSPSLDDMLLRAKKIMHV
jgi:hypothetical protein